MNLKKLLVIALLASVCAQELNPKELSSAEISLEFSGSAKIVGDFESINLTMYSVPVTDDRQISACNVPYPATYIFEKDDSPAYSYSCTVKTKQIGKRITDSKLPLSGEIPEEYLEQTEITSLPSELEKIADGLATDSLIGTAYAVNSWVYRNIEYDKVYVFSLFAGDDAQKRTVADIFRMKKGICGDKAHMAIGMLRHLGIPARYVAGSSYGRLVKETFESHAWVEVYFPNSGWVPFDPTYGEYGYVDPSHVKFYDSLDSSYAVWQTRFTYYNTQPSISWERKEDTKFVKMEKADNFALGAATVKRAEYGDAVLVSAEVTNNLIIPALAEATIHYEASNLENNFGLVWGEKSQTISLPSKGKGNVYWVLRAPTLEAGKYYIIPFTVAVEGTTAEVSLELYPKEAAASLSITPESNSYGEGDDVNLAIEVSPGTAEVTVLPSGTKVLFADGETKKEVTAKADSSLAAVSSAGGFQKADISVEVQSFSVTVEGPSKVAEGKDFELVVKVAGNKGASVKLEMDGESSVAIIPAEFSIRKSLSQDAVLRFTLSSGGKTKVVSKRITVVPRPQLMHTFDKPGSIISGMPALLAAGGNGKVRLKTSYAEKESENNVFLEITPTVCGQNEAVITVTAADELGNVFSEEFGESFEVKCGIDAIIAKILAFISQFLK